TCDFITIPSPFCGDAGAATARAAITMAARVADMSRVYVQALLSTMFDARSAGVVDARQPEVTTSHADTPHGPRLGPRARRRPGARSAPPAALRPSTTARTARRHRPRRHHDAGEPLLRSLLRAAPGRAWVRRPVAAQHVRTAGRAGRHRLSLPRRCQADRRWLHGRPDPPVGRAARERAHAPNVGDVARAVQPRRL